MLTFVSAFLGSTCMVTHRIRRRRVMFVALVAASAVVGAACTELDDTPIQPLSGHGPDADPAVAARLATAQLPETEQAIVRVDQYASSACGVSFS